MILAPAIMQAEKDPKNAAAKCLESVNLDPDLYRIGHTKARDFSYEASLFQHVPHSTIIICNIIEIHIVLEVIQSLQEETHARKKWCSSFLYV